MQISKITKLKNGLYEILITDDLGKEFIFKLSEDIIINNNLYSNKVLSENDFSLLNTLMNYSKIYTSCLNYISFKMRTEYEVTCYLKDKGCDETYIKEIIEKLKRLNYINDKIYSDAYCKHQFEINKKGNNLIKDELLNKKVDISIIENSLQYITKQMIDNNINSLIVYYDKINKNKSIRKLKENILKNLHLKGYDYDIVLYHLNKYQFYDTNNENELIDKELNKLFEKYHNKLQGYDLKNKLIKSLLNKGFIYDDIIEALVSFNMEG